MKRRRMLTKWADWQSDEKACKPGNFAAGKICRRRRLDLTIPKGSANPPKEAVLAPKGAYIDVSDRRMQVQLTQEAKIASDFYLIRAIFVFVGFVSALRRFEAPNCEPRLKRAAKAPPAMAFPRGGRRFLLLPLARRFYFSRNSASWGRIACAPRTPLTICVTCMSTTAPLRSSASLRENP